MVYYEQYISGKIDFDEYKVRQQKIRQVAEDQKSIELEIEEYEQKYRWIALICKVRERVLPLSAITDEINTIVVDTGRKIVVQ